MDRPLLGLRAVCGGGTDAPSCRSQKEHELMQLSSHLGAWAVGSRSSCIILTHSKLISVSPYCSVTLVIG